MVRFFRVDRQEDGANSPIFYITIVGGKVNMILTDNDGNVIHSRNKMEIANIALYENQAEVRAAK